MSKRFSDLPYAWSFGAIALDSVGNKIYWTGLFDPPSSDWNSPSPTSVGIFRSNLDGSNVEEIPTAAAYNVEGYRSLYRYSRSAPTGIALYIPHPTFVSTPSTTPAIPTTSGPRPQFPQPLQRQHPNRLPPRHARPSSAGNLQRLGPTRADAGKPVPARRLLPSPLGRPRPARHSAGSRRLSHPPAPPRRSADPAVALPQVGAGRL